MKRQHANQLSSAYWQQLENFFLNYSSSTPKLYDLVKYINKIYKNIHKGYSKKWLLLREINEKWMLVG